MNFPFTILTGSFVIYTNDSMSNKFCAIRELTILEDGKTAEGLQWETGDGVLHVMSDSDPVYELRGVELINGAIVATGVSYLDNVVKRIVMAEKKPLAGSNWGICVASCPANQKKVMPKFLKGLRRANVDMSKVTVVVGSVPLSEQFDRVEDHVRYVSDTRNLKGLTPVLSRNDGLDYHVLLHDTCVVAEDFLRRIEAVDISTNPDIVLFRPPAESLEMGIYSEGFLLEQYDLESVQGDQRLKTMWGRAKVAMLVSGTVTVKPPEDHYHDGVLRQEVRIPRAGLSKFSTLKTRGGR